MRTSRVRPCLALLAALCAGPLACGARSPLRGEIPLVDASLTDSTDAPSPDALPDERPDAPAPDVCAPATELCNGVDDNCDGRVDEGTTRCGVGECAREAPMCAAGAPAACVPLPPSRELCNGLDDDCDGRADEDLGSASCGVGACARTVDLCSMGSAQTCAPGRPQPETCNRVDDDCNGVVDDYDPGGDGVSDCIAIALMGNSGGYEASDFQRWLRTRGVTVARIHTSPSEALTPASIAPYNLIVLDRLVRAYTPAEASVLQAWVAAGGGLMAMSGYTNTDPDRDYPNSLVAPMGLAYIDLLLNAPVTTFAAHPLNAGLTSVPFIGGFRVALRNPSAVVTARLPEGPVAAALELGRGRVYLWGDEWVEFDSEWRSMPMVTRFWVNAFEWLTHAR